MSNMIRNLGRGLGCFLLLAALAAVIYWFVVRPDVEGEISSEEAPPELPSSSEATSTEQNGTQQKSSIDRDYILILENGTTIPADKIPEDDLPENPEIPGDWDAL